MNIIICSSDFANNHPRKPDQRVDLPQPPGALVGVWRAIKRTPQTNRLHNSSVINNHWSLSPHPKWNLLYLCGSSDKKGHLNTSPRPPDARYEKQVS